MAKLSSINKNERRKKLVKKYAAKYEKLKAIANDESLDETERLVARLKMDESSSSDDEAFRARAQTKAVKKTTSKKRNHVTTDDESEDEGEKFDPPFLHMKDVLLAVPTVNAADELMELDAP